MASMSGSQSLNTNQGNSSGMISRWWNRSNCLNPSIQARAIPTYRTVLASFWSDPESQSLNTDQGNRTVSSRVRRLTPVTSSLNPSIQIRAVRTGGTSDAVQCPSEKSQSLNTGQDSFGPNVDPEDYPEFHLSQFLSTDKGSRTRIYYGPAKQYTMRSQSLNTDQGDSDADGSPCGRAALRDDSIPQYRSGQF
jgi:hypothetical protein